MIGMLKKTLSVMLFCLSLEAVLHAQDVIPTAVTPENYGAQLPFSARIGSEVEGVDLATGSVTLNIPLISVHGRKMNYDFGLR